MITIKECTDEQIRFNEIAQNAKWILRDINECDKVYIYAKNILSFCGKAGKTRTKDLIKFNRELEEQVEVLSDTVNMLSPLMMECHELKEKIKGISKNISQRKQEITTRGTAINLINQERDRQDEIWGEQNHPPQFWTGILGEEYGEYCQAVNETVFNNGEEARKLGGYENMMMELTHVAAVAVGAMEALMRKRAREEAAAIEKTDL